MVLNVNRKELERLLENNEISRFLEIYSFCSTPEELNIMKLFLSNDGYGLSRKDLIRLATIDAVSKIRENDRKELEKQFVPIKKNTNKNDYYTKEETKYFKYNKREIKRFRSTFKDYIGSETYRILKQIYNTKKDECYLGIYDIQYNVDTILEEGIVFGTTAVFEKRIKTIHNYDYLINQISNCNEEKQSYGSVIIKVPKEAIDKKSIPIYYEKDNLIFLNPEYIICYVPVKNKKLLTVEFNDSFNTVISTIYEGEFLGKENVIIKK